MGNHHALPPTSSFWTHPSPMPFSACALVSIGKCLCAVALFYWKQGLVGFPERGVHAAAAIVVEWRIPCLLDKCQELLCGLSKG